jgi:preprotein translocase subunit SecE
MGKEKAVASDSGWGQLLQELVRADLYKRSQGRIVRQVTCLAIWIAFALTAWRLYVYLHAVLTGAYAEYVAFAYAVPAILLVLGFWLGYRLVNLPTFADFLIAVEAEMNKVSWPSQQELLRASLVVIVLIFGLTLVLFAYDNVWAWLLSRGLGVTAV